MITNKSSTNLSRSGKPDRPARRPSGVRRDSMPEELERFFVSSYGRMVGAITLVCRDRFTAEDVVNEALVRAWERSTRAGHAPIRDLDRWVVTVALNLARSRWRKLRREVLRRDVEPEVREQSDRTSGDLEALMETLTPRQREVVALYYVEDLPVRDIATILRLTEGGVKHALHRARQSLAKTISSERAATHDERA